MCVCRAAHSAPATSSSFVDAVGDDSRFICAHSAAMRSRQLYQMTLSLYCKWDFQVHVNGRQFNPTHRKSDCRPIKLCHITKLQIMYRVSVGCRRRRRRHVVFKTRPGPVWFSLHSVRLTALHSRATCDNKVDKTFRKHY
jgi:hypothetical protein